MARWTCLVLIVAGLAGCAADDNQATLADDPEEVPVGVLAGVVVDPAIQPLAGVEVTIATSGLTNTTDSEGRFRFEDMDPGTYTINARRDGYLDTQIVASISDVHTPYVKIVLPVDVDKVAYHSAYQFQGFVECAAFPFNWCAQINIASIILCEGYGACFGNVTADRSLALHRLNGVPDLLQTEMVWDSSNSLGDNFYFVIGGATREEIASGMVAAQNTTRGPSPLMMRLHNDTLSEMSIGGDRDLLTQVHPSPQEEVPGGCVIYDPCGPSVHLMQRYEYFTHAFYGYEPPEDWLFAEHGEPPAPDQ